MKVKEYYKMNYNLRGVEENPKNFELVTLDKLYGKEVDISEWYENLKVDCDLDGGIDFIVINLSGTIIPLIDDEYFCEHLEETFFADNTIEVKQDLIKKMCDIANINMQDELINFIINKINQNHPKLKIDFIQSKSGNSIQEQVLMKINNTFDDLLLKENFESERYSDKLKNNISLIKKLIKMVSVKDGAIEVNLLYIASEDTPPKSMKLHEEIGTKIKSTIIKGINHSNVNIKFLYGEKLIKELKKNIKKEFQIKINRKDILDKKNSFIGLVELKEIEKFVSKNDNLDMSLFDGNVRDYYKTSSNINKEIKSTLEFQIPINDFWWLNNGITIICDKAKYSSGKLIIDSPQIVNGLQSVVTIYNTLKSSSRINQNKKVLIKVLVEKNLENINTIIKTTNTQNPVDDYLLNSTKSIHREIEEYFLSYKSGYYYDRRKNYYKNLNMDKSKIFDIKYTFKTYASIFLGIPSQVRTATKKNFKEKHDEVFNSSINKNAYLYSDLLDRNIQMVLKKTKIDDEFKQEHGVSIITYSLHISYIFTAFLKRTIDFTDKYINSSDINRVENLAFDDEIITKSIKFINEIISTFSKENKVYLARTNLLEEKIKDGLKKILNKEENDEE